MQLKLALAAILLSALAVFALPVPAAPCPPTDTPTSTPPPAPTSTAPAWQTVTTTVTATVTTSSPSAPAPSQGSSGGGGGGQCNTGPVSCCDNVESGDNLSDGTSSLLGLLGVDVNNILNDVGLGCSSLIGGASCSANTLCCEDNNFNGLINIGCVPISIL